MTLLYKKVIKHPRIFLRLFGVEISEFKIILAKLTPLWQKSILDKYKRPGRYYKLPLEQMLLMLLLYYRTYITQMQIGFMFGVHDSNVCRIIAKLEPLVVKIVAISKNRELTYEEAGQLIDVTEQVIERPKYSQKQYYSGKKKRHTLKVEIRVTPEGKIKNVSKSFGGKIHDFALHKVSDPIPINTRIYADSGYQGIAKKHKNSKTPIKKKRGKVLTWLQKKYNKIVAQRRIKVENIFCCIKKFNIISNKYRNKLKKHNLKFNIVCGLVNLRNRFLNKNFA